MIKKLLKLIVVIAIIVFVIGIIDYFLIRAGILNINSDQLPEFLRPLFKN